MGIRVYCPNGHKLNVKETQAGRRGICPQCGAKFTIPATGEETGPDDADQNVSVPPELPRVSPQPKRPEKRSPAGPAGLPVITQSTQPPARRRRQSTQLVVWLTMAVIVLGAVFAWVVSR
ncbi:MAG: hypothetical protein JW719_06645 [Pirellulales bacterium]|nr:hypothetical protein [Pirellulales bacterium]